MTTKGQNYAFITPAESEDDNENLSEENKLNENSEEDEWLRRMMSVNSFPLLQECKKF